MRLRARPQRQPTIEPLQQARPRRAAPQAAATPQGPASAPSVLVEPLLRRAQALPLLRSLVGWYQRRGQMTPAKAWKRQKIEVGRFIAALRQEQKHNSEVQALMRALRSPAPQASAASLGQRGGRQAKGQLVHLEPFLLVLTPKGFFHTSVFYSVARLNVATLQ
ncbi:MAG: hypothetical protein EOO40_06135, partial [Deltaproteobacteria bacterium]